MPDSSVAVRRFAGASEFRERAEPWLLRREAEHNLLLGLLPVLETSPGLFRPPIYLATVEMEGDVAGCVFRTPPFKLGLTRLPAKAIPHVVEDVARVYDSIPAALGPPEMARAFAERWCERVGGTPRDGMRQRIFQLERVIPPEKTAPGKLRAATAADLALVVSWFRTFADEAGAELHDIEMLARERVNAGNVFFWEDGEPVCMATWSGETPNGARIGPVYTPPSRRGGGYATACVATLSQRTLDRGKRFCFLYTDLANPTSNRIYERIGYRPVTDVLDVHLGAPAPE